MKEGEEKFLIDTNCFITPYQFYYAFDIAPRYWELLSQRSNAERIVLLDRVKAELVKRDDELTSWLSGAHFEECSFKDASIISVYSEVLQYVQESAYYNEKALNAWSQEDVADPWLIATAKAKDYTLITLETGSGGLNANTPSKNPKIPDVAKEFGVKTQSLFYMMRALNIKM